jgi:hypothetical protein
LELLAELFRSIAESADAEEVSSPYGRRFRVRTQLDGPEGSQVPILTIWIVSSEGAPPRFVMAYPEE